MARPAPTAPRTRAMRNRERFLFKGIVGVDFLIHASVSIHNAQNQEENTSE
jgi:hypothetical protein